MGENRKIHKNVDLLDPSRRDFMRNAGLAGVAVGTATVLGNFGHRAGSL